MSCRVMELPSAHATMNSADVLILSFSKARQQAIASVFGEW